MNIDTVTLEQIQIILSILLFLCLSLHTHLREKHKINFPSELPNFGDKRNDTRTIVVRGPNMSSNRLSL